MQLCKFAGVDAKFKGVKTHTYIQIGEIQELREIISTESETVIGASCNLSQIQEFCVKSMAVNFTSVFFYSPCITLTISQIQKPEIFSQP